MWFCFERKTEGRNITLITGWNSTPNQEEALNYASYNDYCNNMWLFLRKKRQEKYLSTSSE